MTISQSVNDNSNAGIGAAQQTGTSSPSDLSGVGKTDTGTPPPSVDSSAVADPIGSGAGGVDPIANPTTPPVDPVSPDPKFFSDEDDDDDEEEDLAEWLSDLIDELDDMIDQTLVQHTDVGSGGNAGTDVAAKNDSGVFDVGGRFQDFNIEIHADGSVSLSSGGGNADQTTTSDRLLFDDGEFALDVDAGENAGSAYRIYQAAFDRTPDSEGLKFWIDQVDAGKSLADVAMDFVNSTEFANVYGVDASNEDFIAKLYQNVLGRDGDEDGLAYWIGLLESGAQDKAGVLSQFSESAENIANVAPVISDGIFLA